MSYRSRPARAICRRAADPCRSGRARQGQLRIAVRCPSADPIRCPVDRHRLDAALGRCARRRRACDRGQADRPVRGPLGGVAGACPRDAARDAAAAPRRGRRWRRRGRARAFGTAPPGRTEGRRGRGNPRHPRPIAAVAQRPGPPVVRADPRRSPGYRARRQRRHPCRAACSALRRWHAGRIRRGTVGDPGGRCALARRHRPAANAGGLYCGRRQAALARRPADLCGRRRGDDARPSPRQGGSLRRPTGSAARRQLAARARRAAAAPRRAAKARPGADRHRGQAGRSLARPVRDVWPAAVAVEGLDRPPLDAALHRTAGNAPGAGRRPDALRRLRRQGSGSGSRLRPATSAAVMIGLDSPDDAALISFPGAPPLLQTVDFFRAMVDDPYLFGRIAATHALGDIYAMGGSPESALAIATLPPGRPPIVEHDLFHMLRGGLDVLEPAGAVLIGGHSAEGAEPALGFAVTGRPRPGKLLRKAGLRPGDRLVLTKPLGTGVILAAAARGLASSRLVEAAIATMVQSAAFAAACLLAHRASACTDVTGFGLLGHLLEMLRASGVDAVLDPEAIPALDGALPLLGSGVTSSLHADNIAALAALDPAAQLHRIAPLLIDPQTAGGLLAGVPADRAAACLGALCSFGYRAALIGRVARLTDDQPRVRFEEGAAQPLPELVAAK